MTDKRVFRVIRIVTATEITPEKIEVIAKRFAEHFNISGYSVTNEVDSSLIGGFVIFASGYRFDFSVKGQLTRIGKHLKTSRHISSDDEALSSTETDVQKIRQSIDDALLDFDEQPTALFDQDLLWDEDGNDVSTGNVSNARSLVDRLREQLENSFSETATVEEVGQVLSISDGVAIVKGIENCLSNEMILFSSGVYGIAMNLETDTVGVILLGDASKTNEGMACKRTGKTVNIVVGKSLLGRVVDPLGNPIDGKGAIRSSTFRPLESCSPGIIERSPVNTPLQTGITAIDALTPIGRGQRELIIGDRQTGKTAIAIDTIINQRDKKVLCVYVAIGQKMSNIVQTVATLKKHNALSYTVIVAASASQTASLEYIAPFSGCAIAEHFMYEDHKDVLIVYDDLTRHAQAYRAISLLLRRPPGREAYPGDVFYLHSRLLERSAKMSESFGGGSITALPIVETLGGDISAYIPTNVISITDGQIYLESELFFSGQRPAINVGLSVSRVGGAAQTKAMKKVAGPMRINLAQAREMAAFAQFGADLDENTQLQLKRGVILNEVLKQSQYSPLQHNEQVIILYLATGEKMNFLDREDVWDYVNSFLQRMKGLHPEVLLKIDETQDLSSELQAEIDKIIGDHSVTFVAEHPEYDESE